MLDILPYDIYLYLSPHLSLVDHIQLSRVNTALYQAISPMISSIRTKGVVELNKYKYVYPFYPTKVLTRLCAIERDIYNTDDLIPILIYSTPIGYVGCTSIIKRITTRKGTCLVKRKYFDGYYCLSEGVANLLDRYHIQGGVGVSKFFNWMLNQPKVQFSISKLRRDIRFHISGYSRGDRTLKISTYGRSIIDIKRWEMYILYNLLKTIDIEWYIGLYQKKGSTGSSSSTNSISSIVVSS